jgi:outer membrane protein OmpA-like peptidoglycan-associated protein
MYPTRRFFSVSSLLILCALSTAALSASDEVRYSLFNDIEETFKTANASKANILAPKNYEEAADLYRRASERYDKGQGVDRIRSDLARAKSYLLKSIEATSGAEAAFASAIQARGDAEAAQAESLADTDWQTAEKTFAEAARRLEAGNEKRALTEASDAETLYRAAELNAIKINYLSETTRLIEQAQKDRVDRYAPLTLTKAQKLLQEAEKALVQNRYDTDQPRSLARQARYEAKHAVYIAGQVKALRDEEFTEEVLMLRSEQAVDGIASALDLVAEFDQGAAVPAEQIRQRIESLRQDSYDLGQRKNDIAALETEIRELETQLGVQSERLAQQEDYRRRFTEIEKMFSRDEAAVLTQEGDVLIRTLGLNFHSGSSQIDSQYYPLLRKIQEAVHLFPNTEVVVEGHTDSFGGDEQNLNLSVARAEAVRQYLLANMTGLRPEQINAIGYGETKPIGNNETIEGRTKNRRIDLVLKRKPPG